MRDQNYFLSKILSELLTYMRCIGYEKLTVSSSSVSLTPPSNAKYALCVVESTVTDQIALRYLETGAAPTSSNGMPRWDQGAFDILGTDNIRSFKAIQATAGTHAINVQYYG